MRSDRGRSYACRQKIPGHKGPQRSVDRLTRKLKHHGFNGSTAHLCTHDGFSESELLTEFNRYRAARKLAFSRFAGRRPAGRILGPLVPEFLKPCSRIFSGLPSQPNKASLGNRGQQSRNLEQVGNRPPERCLRGERGPRRLHRRAPRPRPRSKGSRSHKFA
jgi:hypothetical protein